MLASVSTILRLPCCFVAHHTLIDLAWRAGEGRLAHAELTDIGQGVLLLLLGPYHHLPKILNNGPLVQQLQLLGKFLKLLLVHNRLIIGHLSSQCLRLLHLLGKMIMTMRKIVDQGLTCRLTVSIIGPAKDLGVVHGILREAEVHHLLSSPLTYARVLRTSISLAARIILESFRVLRRVRNPSVFVCLLLRKDEFSKLLRINLLIQLVNPIKVPWIPNALQVPSRKFPF